MEMDLTEIEIAMVEDRVVRMDLVKEVKMVLRVEEMDLKEIEVMKTIDLVVEDLDKAKVVLGPIEVVWDKEILEIQMTDPTGTETILTAGKVKMVRTDGMAAKIPTPEVREASDGVPEVALLTVLVASMAIDIMADMAVEVKKVGGVVADLVVIDTDLVEMVIGMVNLEAVKVVEIDMAIVKADNLIAKVGSTVEIEAILEGGTKIF
uniref:Uncharacterized protein n=1 Tax=Acrobeloides nanus TaxID=290746 RepID=A0A914CQQ9_9BILA